MRRGRKKRTEKGREKRVCGIDKVLELTINRKIQYWEAPQVIVMRKKQRNGMAKRTISVVANCSGARY